MKFAEFNNGHGKAQYNTAQQHRTNDRADDNTIEMYHHLPSTLGGHASVHALSSRSC